MTHEDARESLSLYVLGVLDGPEREAVDAHVRDCESCQRKLGDEQRTLDAIARGAEQVRPRPELRERVLAHTRQARVVTMRERPAPAKPPRWQWVALAAAASIAVVAGIGLLRARAEIDRLQQTLVTWQARVAEAEQRANTAVTEVTYQRQALAVLTSGDLVQARLDGLPPAQEARARAFVSLSQNTVMMSALGLPAPTDQRVYQLWAIVDGQAVSIGIFTPDADGRGQLIGALAPGSATPSALAVTLEPAGGVPQPTGPKYLLGAPLS